MMMIISQLSKLIDRNHTTFQLRLMLKMWKRVILTFQGIDIPQERRGRIEEKEDRREAGRRGGRLLRL